MPNTESDLSKTCPKCQLIFSCRSSEDNQCWCADATKYPPTFEPDPTLDCLCPSCLNLAIKARIEKYVNQMTPEKALLQNVAKDLPKSPTKEGIDYYFEDEFMVFTAWFHLKRGHCCKNKCRHCPYGIHLK